MVHALKALWNLFAKFGAFIGNVVSAIFLTVFYYTVFALFAIPFKLFGKSFGRTGDSRWFVRERNPRTIEDFRYE